MSTDPGRPARGHEATQVTAHDDERAGVPRARRPPRSDAGPLVLSDVYLLTAESGGNVAVPGLTVVLDGSGLTVRKPDGAVGAVVAWADVSGLVASRADAHPGGKPRRHRRGGHRHRAPTVSSSPATTPTGSSTRSTQLASSGRRGPTATLLGSTTTIRSADRSTRCRRAGDHRAGCPHRDRNSEVLTVQDHLTKRGKPATRDRSSHNRNTVEG